MCSLKLIQHHVSLFVKLALVCPFSNSIIIVWISMLALVIWNWNVYPDSVIFSYDFKNPSSSNLVLPWWILVMHLDTLNGYYITSLRAIYLIAMTTNVGINSVAFTFSIWDIGWQFIHQLISLINCQNGNSFAVWTMQ